VSQLPDSLKPAGLFLLMVLVLSGCGYQFTVDGAGPVIGGGERVAEGPQVRLALRTLKNNTFEPGLEFKYTRYLRRALQSTGGVSIVDDDLSADFIIDGAIVSVTLPSVAFSQTRTQESRVTVKVAVKVRHRKTGKIRWTQTNTKSAEFFVGASSSSSEGGNGLQFNRALQDRALEQAGYGAAEGLADQFLSARDQGKFGVESVKPSPTLGSSGANTDTSLSPTSSVKPFPSPTTPVE
jgi:outer membrane lipopolysaccharide assembly protein LptE/RlpB